MGVLCSDGGGCGMHAVTSISWARARTEAGPRPDGPAINGNGLSEAKTVNAVVTTSVDLSVRVWTP